MPLTVDRDSGIAPFEQLRSGVVAVRAHAERVTELGLAPEEAVTSVTRALGGVGPASTRSR